MMEFVKKLNCGITAEIITHFCYAQNVLPMILSGNSDVFLNKLIIIFYIMINILIAIRKFFFILVLFIFSISQNTKAFAIKKQINVCNFKRLI